MTKHFIFLLYLVCTGINSANANELTFGVHPYLSPAELTKRFTPLVKYLGKELDAPLRLYIGQSYQEHIDTVGQNRIDLAYVGPAAYVEIVQQFGQKALLGRLEIKNAPVLTGVLIVRNNSPLKSLADLKGKRIAFGDKLSTMGYVVPRYVLHKAGIDMHDLNSHSFVNSHVNVVLGVLAGDFDAGAVKRETFDKYRERGVRVLATLPPISEHVFVASKNLSPELIAAARKALLSLRDKPEGKAIMEAINPEMTGIVAVSDADYDNLRVMLKAVKAADTK